MVNMIEVINETNQRKFSFALRLKSFTYAWSGLKTVFLTEHNSRIHLAFTICMLALSIIFKVTIPEFSLLIIATAMVWMAELFNTCIEKIMDFLSTEKHPQIKRIKDMAAAAVLLASFVALIVGAIIFIPKILNHVPFSG